VKKVRIFGKWNILKSGAILVDAPGVNDDNSARDGIVKRYLKNADSIWIVSNINRAVNDKTAKGTFFLFLECLFFAKFVCIFEVG
jgi:hypothetical protein